MLAAAFAGQGRESGHQQAMRLLAASGRRGDALAQFDRLKQILAEELNVEPTSESVALYLACLRIGAVYVPLNTAYTPAEVDFFLGLRALRTAFLTCVAERRRSNGSRPRPSA